MSILIFFMIIVLLFLTLVFRIRKLKGVRFLLVLIISFILSYNLYFKITKGFFPALKQFNPLLNYIFFQEDLYSPVVVDDFLFYRKGYKKEYSLKIKYVDTYRVYFSVEPKYLPEDYKFKGKIKAEFFYKEEKIREQIITSINGSWLVNPRSTNVKDTQVLNHISLLKFKIPLKGKYKNKIKLRLTVLEPDMQLKSFAEYIKLYVGVTSLDNS
ncbi:hypothetical protein [Orenia marismortui]|uniref:Uncharacterized protein n=1 Tax=Orenia marismortui TaxID=46469 RepID=A0A4R8H055_9FIRM|nr:hypothetical protein [Orenia marismortui]TDX51128.1 hypothetical protein C7959_1154 [Orenia marismortui]